MPPAAMRRSRGQSMDATTVFVIVIVSIFVGGMAAIQIYIHSGKGDESKGEKRKDT